MCEGLDPAGQLAAICRFASNYGYRVRAVGTGSSWSRLTSTRDILIDMKDLNRILTPKPTNRNDNLQKEYVDIEVEGGMQVYRFVEKLDKAYGLALPMMGNYAGQTVAGVASTSTHGSGYFAGTMVCSIANYCTSEGNSNAGGCKPRNKNENKESCEIGVNMTRLNLSSLHSSLEMRLLSL